MCVGSNVIEMKSIRKRLVYNWKNYKTNIEVLNGLKIYLSQRGNNCTVTEINSRAHASITSE
jgi:hypothetical protein